jgi:hypothetical protein
MKAPDIKSVLVAAVIGAMALYAWDSSQNQPTAGAVVQGAVIGAAVQIGVRLLGVS